MRGARVLADAPLPAAGRPAPSLAGAAGALARSGLRGGWLATLLTAACVTFFLVTTDLDELGRAIHQADYRQLCLALGLSSVTVVVKGLRWRSLYPRWARPGVGVAVAGVAVGQVANWAAPLRAGEVLRVSLVSTPNGADRGRTVGVGVGVLIVEKLLDCAILLATVAALVVLVGVPDWLSRSALLVALTGCVAGLGLAFRLRGRAAAEWAALGRAWFTGRWPARAAWLLSEVASLGEGLSAWFTPGQAMRALAWSLVAWGLGAATNYVGFKSVEVDPRPALAAALAVLAALYGAAVVPALPGRLGVFQYLCVVSLVPFGVALNGALVFSLALYVAVYVPPVLIGLASTLIMGRAPWHSPRVPLHPK